MWTTPLLSQKMVAITFLVDLVALNFFVFGMFPFHGFLFALLVIMIKPGFITGYNPKMKIIWVGVVLS